MAQQRVILIQPQAPPKPGFGAPCNGCGVCCLAEPCPVGMLLSLKRHGACVALRWDEAACRYVCGALLAAPWPVNKLMQRWIAAGAGCDADFEASAPGKP